MYRGFSMNYKKDDILIGKVTGIVKYGIFLSFPDDYCGLVHISEMSYDYISDIKQYISLNDEIEVKVLDVDSDTKKMQLTMKGISAIKSVLRSKNIEETEHGFSTLRKNLPIWIEEKLKNKKNISS